MKRNNIFLGLTLVFIIVGVFLLNKSLPILFNYQKELGFVKNQNESFKHRGETLKEENKNFEDMIANIDKVNLEVDEKILQYESLGSSDLESTIKEVSKKKSYANRTTFDGDRVKSLAPSVFKYKRLLSTHYGKVAEISLESSKRNILYSEGLLSNYIYSTLNKNIVNYNSGVDKSVGVLKYLNSGSNYLVKKKLMDRGMENYTNIENPNGDIFLKEYMFSLYDNILMPESGKNIEYLKNLESTISTLKKNFGKGKYSDGIRNKYVSLVDLQVFQIETLAENIDNLPGFSIVDKTYEIGDKTDVIRSLKDSRGRVLFIQQKSGDDVKKVYFYDNSGRPYYYKDLNSETTIYFGIDKNEKEYNNATALYNEFK